ncbi:MAG: Gfo/Idh/MocA family oxidoreductase [Magnetovibrio sp.]|nr:Gfo/Idh/MocA family oxidoreductase [Magnetovibrio sp.]
MTRTPEYGIGIVGTGHGARVTAPAFLADPRSRIRGFAAARADSAAQAAAELGCEAYVHWRALIDDPAVDAVAIATPPAVQPEIAVAALEAGKAVLMEKPVAADVAAAARVEAAAAASGGANLIGFIFPEVPSFAAARDMLAGGAIGEIERVDVDWRVLTYANQHRLESWKTRADGGGGTLFNFGAHVLFYLEWMAGRVETLRAALDKAPDDPRDGDTAARLEMAFSSGASGAVSLDAATDGPPCHRIAFAGADGALILENSGSDYVGGFTLSLERNGVAEVVAGDAGSTAPQGDGRIAATAKLAARLLDWVETGAASEPNARHGLRVQFLLDCARRADQEGATVETTHHAERTEAAR